MSKHGTIIKCSMCGDAGHNKSECKKNPEREKKKNAHLTKTTKKNSRNEQASRSGTTPQAQAPQAQASGSATASARTTTVPQASAPGTKANRFKPPRKRVATTEA